jgi:WD40 repeat protein
VKRWNGRFRFDKTSALASNRSVPPVTPSGEPIGVPLQGHKYDVNSVAFSPDGTRIVSASHDGTLRLWDAKSAEPVGKLLQAHDWVYCAAFSPDGSRIASGQRG